MQVTLGRDARQGSDREFPPRSGSLIARNQIPVVRLDRAVWDRRNHFPGPGCKPAGVNPELVGNVKYRIGTWNAAVHPHVDRLLVDPQEVAERRLLVGNTRMLRGRHQPVGEIFVYGSGHSAHAMPYKVYCP